MIKTELISEYLFVLFNGSITILKRSPTIYGGPVETLKPIP